MILGSVAAVLIAFAAYRFFTAGPDIPTDRSTWVWFKCPDCQKRFYLDGRQLDKELNRMGRRGPSPESNQGFTCPGCGQRRAQRDPDQSG